MQTGSLQADSHISSLSWNLEGTRLLTGGVTIQMWHERILNKDDEPARKLFALYIFFLFYTMNVYLGLF